MALRFVVVCFVSVTLDTCVERSRALFQSADKRFDVTTDGTVALQRQVTLHEGRKVFAVHTWDSSGKKHTVFAGVERAHHHEGHRHEDHHMDAVVNTTPQMESSDDLMIVKFPRSSAGLKRPKRDWVIPPFNEPENSKGPFPKKLSQIKSDYASETFLTYSITGEGADQPPVGLFKCDKITGIISVTKPLDREKKASYNLTAYAVGEDDIKEKPMEIMIYVIDQNDNRPEFTQNPFNGQVPEAALKDYEFMMVTATDADDPTTENADVRYTIISQNPPLPKPNMFDINTITGGIHVSDTGLDREKYSTYTLLLQATDMQGNGMITTGTAVITVTDSNDNAPQFEQTTYEASVPENQFGVVVAQLTVTDGDEPRSPAWSTKYKIISGDKGGFFSVSTGPSQLEGIITTVKPLDYEKIKQYILSVIVENEDPFVGFLPTSTATVTVNVEDVNEPPEFKPKEHNIYKPEDLPVDTELITYTAIDPDTAQAQKLTYRIISDPAGWLKVIKETGAIKVKKQMDRESGLIIDGKYKVLILAVDDDVKMPATGTGTLIIQLEDVNDNPPSIVERDIQMCNSEAPPALLSITDEDGAPHAGPFSVDTQGETQKNWTARMNDQSTQIELMLRNTLEPGIYNVILRVFDQGDMYQDNTIQATVCDCEGEDVVCNEKWAAVLLEVLGILVSILALLLLLLLLVMFLRRKCGSKKEPLLPEDDIWDHICYHDEQGGGEDDQDYDLGVLLRGLDNRPGIMRNDGMPTLMPAPQYRPRRLNPEEIGMFINDSLKAADNDPKAPSYDSLLAFNYEGGGSAVGSLSSLISSSSENDQDYDFISQWGLRFKKLADMFGGGED